MIWLFKSQAGQRSKLQTLLVIVNCTVNIKGIMLYGLNTKYQILNKRHSSSSFILCCINVKAPLNQTLLTPMIRDFPSCFNYWIPQQLVTSLYSRCLMFQADETEVWIKTVRKKCYCHSRMFSVRKKIINKDLD